MFKKLICIVLLICLCSSLFAIELPNPKPYSADEFPELVLNLRRAEIIFAGSIPLVYPLANMVMKAVDSQNQPDFWKTFAISCSVSAAIAVMDYVFGLFQD